MASLTPFQKAPYGNVLLSDIVIDEKRTENLTEFSIKKLESQYLRGLQTPQERFGTIATHYAYDADHGQRLYDGMSKLWFMPATPIVSNGGTKFGLPASCFVNEVTDTLKGLSHLYDENIYLASKGGGIGTYWGNLRSLGESVGKNGHTSGIIPFIHVMDSLTLAVSQGCVDGDTEILTENGFIKFSDLNKDHGRVWQVDEHGAVSLATPSEYHAYPYQGVMHHYVSTDDKGNVVLDQFVTPNHRLVSADYSLGTNDLTTGLSIVESQHYQSLDRSAFVGVSGVTSSDDVAASVRIPHTLIPYAKTQRTLTSFDGTVYCVTVPTGMFIVRRNDTVCVTGNSMRRGSAATYLPMWHPEIEEFIDMRRPTGGDPNRKNLNLHHGVLVSNAFMRQVETDGMWQLRSPKTGEVIREVTARSLWIKLLLARMEQGEPYIIFEDRVNELMPAYQRQVGLCVKTSNLCSEITLPTGIDQYGRHRTAVCFLSSFNLETYDEWKDNTQFIEDVFYMMDAVVQDLIDNAPPEMADAIYGAMRERAIGVGVMGFHSFLQQRNIPFESALAKVWNKKIFKDLRAHADAASKKLAIERGACPDAADADVLERFSCKLAVAPTASISVICGEASPGIDPIAGCLYMAKGLTGNQEYRNPYLVKLLKDLGKDTDEVWSSIRVNKGSVQHLDFLTTDQKEVYKTAFEIDQRWVIEHAADRTPYICQSQPVNLFLPPDVHKADLHGIHYLAWEKGLKSLYYCRSYSVQQSDSIVGEVVAPSAPRAPVQYDECLACQ